MPQDALEVPGLIAPLSGRACPHERLGMRRIWEVGRIFFLYCHLGGSN
jgi:hypothetical protein